MRSCGLPFTVEAQRVTHSSSWLPISQLWLCYCHSTNTLGVHMKTALQKWTSKKWSIKAFTYRHCERKAILPVLSHQESRKKCSTDLQGKIRAHTLHPTFTMLQVPHSHLSFMNEKFIWKGGFYSLLLCSPWRGITKIIRGAFFFRSSIKPGKSPGLVIGQEDTGFSCTRGGLGWTLGKKNPHWKDD